MLVVGAGRRVAEDVLPVVDALSDRVELVGIAGRDTRTQELAGRTRAVTALPELLAGGALARCDLAYVVVAKGAVPGVVARLAAAEGAARCGLLLETPGLLCKHLGHLHRLRAFRSVSMAEDSVALPWVTLARRAVAEGPLGPLREVRLEHAAWRYHGVALLKALFDAPVRSARRRGAVDAGEVTFRFAGGGVGTLVEPRDYHTGHVVLVGARATASDAPERVPGALPLVLMRAPAVAQAGELRVRLGDLSEPLSPAEVALLGAVPDSGRVIAAMHGLKRVGLARMLLDLADGRPGYALAEGLDDMAIDWTLEKTARWLATPFTSLRSPLGRALAGTLLRPLARR
jgi:hypothetical protein